MRSVDAIFDVALQRIGGCRPRRPTDLNVLRGDIQISCPGGQIRECLALSAIVVVEGGAIVLELEDAAILDYNRRVR